MNNLRYLLKILLFPFMSFYTVLIILGSYIVQLLEWVNEDPYPVAKEVREDMLGTLASYFER